MSKKTVAKQQFLFDFGLGNDDNTGETASECKAAGFPEATREFAGDEADTASKQMSVAVGKQRRQLQRAVLYWMLTARKPTAAATDVVTRISRLRADVAAFWSVAERNPHEEGPRQLLRTERTAIVQCYVQRDECWPDCAKAEEVLPLLRELREQLADQEERIRTEEPELRDDNTLFEEYAEWRYEDSRNREYHRIRREIEKCEHALYNGTRFEQIRAALLADDLYLAVPEGMVQVSELCEGWGLLWVKDDLSVSVVAHPQHRDCHPAHRAHLVQHIAEAATGSVMFAAGMRRTGGGGIKLVKTPRGYQKADSSRLGLQHEE